MARPSAWAAACLLTVAIGCSSTPPSRDTGVGRIAEPIVGGTPTAPGAFPNVVWLDNFCTGVLVHPDVLLTAAHCTATATQAWFDTGFELSASNEPVPSRPGRSVPLQRCESFPGASLYDGTDIAMCVLSQSVLDVPIVRPALNCERDGVVSSTMATLLGFGYDEANSAGTLRRLDTVVTDAGNEFVIGQDGLGTCAGDSGGPALIRVPSRSGQLEWRLLGILSSGKPEACGVGYYSDVSRFVTWIEAVSQRELSPCFDSTSWKPTALCLAPPLDPLGMVLNDRTFSSSCGQPFDASSVDTEPPQLELHTRAVDVSSRIVDIDVDATDVGWGIRRVEIDLVDQTGGSVLALADEIPPYEFRHLALPMGATKARARALDYAGLEAIASADLMPSISVSGGCQLTSPSLVLRTPLAVAAFALLALARRARPRSTLPP